MKAKFVFILLGLVFIFPFLALVFYFRLDLHPNFTELFWAFKNSVLQGGSAALICVTLGFYFAMGLQGLDRQRQNLLCKLSLVPMVLPSLFSILIGFAIVDPFPMGHIGVIFVFTLIHLGFATVLIHEAIQSQMGNYGQIAQIYNISRFQIISKILVPLIRPQLWIVFVLIFLSCFASLSVPLIVGGGRGTNIEVLIYEKIFIDGNWSFATTLSLLQNVLLVLIGIIFIKEHGISQYRVSANKVLSSKPALMGLIFYLALYVGSYLYKVAKAFSVDFFRLVFNQQVKNATANSFSVFLGFLFIFTLFCLAMAYLKYRKLNTRFMTYLLSPSSVLIGFSLYLVFPSSSLSDFIKMAYGLFLLSAMGLFKSFLEPKLLAIDKQLITGRVYGIRFRDLVFKVLWPQFKSRYLFVSSILFLISLSDFAFIKASGAQLPMMGTLIESYLSSYRMDGAFLLSFYILVLWLVYFILTRVFYVSDSES